MNLGFSLEPSAFCTAEFSDSASEPADKRRISVSYAVLEVTGFRFAGDEVHGHVVRRFAVDACLPFAVFTEFHFHSFCSWVPTSRRSQRALRLVVFDVSSHILFQ